MRYMGTLLWVLDCFSKLGRKSISLSFSIGGVVVGVFIMIHSLNEEVEDWDFL